MSSATATRIATATHHALDMLAAQHEQSEWANAELKARHARGFSRIGVVPDDTSVHVIHPTSHAADVLAALDIAAEDDNADGHILSSEQVDGYTVTTYHFATSAVVTNLTYFRSLAAL